MAFNFSKQSGKRDNPVVGASVRFGVSLMLALVALIVGMSGLDTDAEDDNTNGTVINAENVAALTSVAGVDFDAAPQAAGTFNTADFNISHDGQYIATFNSDDQVVVWNDTGALVGVQSGPGDVVGAAFPMDDDAVVGMYQEPGQITLHQTGFETNASLEAVIETEAFPQQIWIDSDGSAWIETLAGGEGRIVNIGFAPDAEATRVPYGPGSDPDAVVRVGRIPPPYAMTSAEDGTVKRWNLETGKVTATAQVANGPAVFGQLSSNGRYFAWRDPQSTTLYLLDFQTGDNREIAGLDGQYVQGYFVSNDGSVILGVDVDFEPIVVAWDTETGAKQTLGTYRECSRVPDLIRMSADATTLVIGCDTGLDIWRVDSAD